MFFKETFSVAAFNIWKEEVNLNRKRNLQASLKSFRVLTKTRNDLKRPTRSKKRPEMTHNE